MLTGMIAVPSSDRNLPDGSEEPLLVIFDTDIGNDVDDALALGILHALESRGKCRLLAVTVSKDHPQAASFVDAVNTFYGRGEIPIGVVRDGPTPAASTFTVLAAQHDEAQARYPHVLQSGEEAPEATSLLRKILKDPISALKAQASNGRYTPSMVNTLRSIYQLDKPKAVEQD